MCFYPIKISVPDLTRFDPETGAAEYKPMLVSCGRCPECQSLKSQEWAWRCVDEASLYSKNCFITLTYAVAPLNGVVRRDVQLFLKLLRNRLKPLKLRYFGCGEYGKLHKRPHYHLLLFNYEPDDLQFYRMSPSGVPVYISQFFNDVWKLGYVYVERGVNFDNAKYSSLYMQKVLPMPADKNPPFRMMSRMPGIGVPAVLDKWGEYGVRYYNGKRVPLPRIYLTVLESRGIDCLHIREHRVFMSEHQDWDARRRRKKKFKNFSGKC